MSYLSPAATETKASEQWRQMGFAGPLAMIFRAIDTFATGRRKPTALPWSDGLSNFFVFVAVRLSCKKRAPPITAI
jgi:hypothetical protein